MGLRYPRKQSLQWDPMDKRKSRRDAIRAKEDGSDEKEAWCMPGTRGESRRHQRRAKGSQLQKPDWVRYGSATVYFMGYTVQMYEDLRLDCIFASNTASGMAPPPPALGRNCDGESHGPTTPCLSPSAPCSLACRGHSWRIG